MQQHNNSTPSQDFLTRVQRFLTWTGRKIVLHFQEQSRSLYFSEGEVWWASLGENIGSETNGKNSYFERPVVILKKFCKDMILVLPTTTQQKQGSWYFALSVNSRNVQVILAQARTISPQRLIRKMDTLSSNEFQGMRQAFLGLIKTDPSTIVVGSSEPPARPK